MHNINPTSFDVFGISFCGSVSQKTKKTMIGSWILLFAICVSGIIGIQFVPNTFTMVCDGVERQPDGTTFMTVSSIIGEFSNNIERWTYAREADWDRRLIQIDSNYNILWEVSIQCDHVVTNHNGYIWFSNTRNDSIKAMLYDTQKVVWQYDLKDLNFTKINPEWGSEHYYNTPGILNDWSHINDIEFKDYGLWESVLIDIRNFNMTLEVNLTSAFTKTHADEADITWWFVGDMFHQHNPDYLDDGNILISDSDNRRIIIVNYTTREIIWQWSRSDLIFARDADILQNGNMLVTDMDKVFEIDLDTNETIWFWNDHNDLFGCYEADRLPNGNTLIATGEGGRVVEVTPAGEIVWQYGTNSFKNIMLCFAFVFIIGELMIVSLLRCKKASLIVMGILLAFHISTVVMSSRVFAFIFTLVSH